MKNFGWWVIVLAAGLGLAAAQTDRPPAKFCFWLAASITITISFPKR